MGLYVQEKQFHIDKERIWWSAMDAMITVPKDGVQ